MKCRYFARLCSLTVLILLGASCKDFLDVNEDLDSPYTSTPNYLLPPVIANMAVSIYDHGETAAYHTQQVATLSGTHLEKDRWDYLRAHRVPQWRRHYHDIAVNAKHVIEAAQRENSTNYEGVAKILFALSTLYTTDAFGDMPYTEALEGNPSPKYDDQEFIYEQILQTLDAAIQVLENTDLERCRPMTSREDIIYGGDLHRWIQLAKAIKARALLHLRPNVTDDYSEVIAVAEDALQDWRDALFDYSLGNGSSSQTNLWGPSKARPSWDIRANILDNSAPTRFFLLSALQYDEVNQQVYDPRQPLLMQPNAKGQYLYVLPSEGKDPSRTREDYPNLYGSYMTRDDAPLPFFTREELHFILAEAYFQQGQRSTAFQHFVDGIRSHMQRVGVGQQSIDDFIQNGPIPHNADQLTLSNIMMQKYIALWLQGETWVDFRRYDYDPDIYPGLKRPKNLAYYWSKDDPDEWLERIIYDTETEEIYNKPELERLGAYQNPEWLKKPMFWAK